MMGVGAVTRRCEEPIFIVGSIRSGTTWLQSLMTLSPELFSCPETKFFQNVLDPHRILSHYDRYPQRAKPPVRRIDADALELSFAHMEELGLIRLDDGAKGALRAAAREGRLDPALYLDHLMFSLRDGKRAAASRWIEKTPKHIFFLEDILRSFPKAKIVCIYRDPVDIMLSIRKSFRVPYLEGLRDLTNSYRAFERFVRDHPERRAQIMTVSYERIRNDPAIVNEILAFAGCRPIDPKAFRERGGEAFAALYDNTAMTAIQPKMRTDGNDGPVPSDEGGRYLRMVVRLRAKCAGEGVAGYVQAYPRARSVAFFRPGFAWFGIMESVKFAAFHCRAAAVYLRSCCRVPQGRRDIRYAATSGRMGSYER